MAKLVLSANIVRAWIMRTCGEQREEVKASLRAAQGRVLLLWDIWSTSNNMSLLGVCAHWIDTKGIKQEALIALPRVCSYHTKDIAAVLHTVIKIYGIDDRLGAFQGDNASNNDTTIETLAQTYNINATEQRLRCLRHVVNLIVQALLYGKNLTTLSKELESASDVLQFKIWRQQGAIGKLHNLIVYICRSEQRTSVFNDI